MSRRDENRLDSGGYTRSHSVDRTSPSEVFRILQTGHERTIVAVVDEKGECQAYGYLETLGNPGQAQFKARFERYTQQGFLRSPEEMRMIRAITDPPPVFEIKTRSGHRAFGIEEKGRFVITHIVKKPSRKQVSKHARKAQEIYQEARERNIRRGRTK